MKHLITILLLFTVGCINTTGTTNPPLKEDSPTVRLCAEWTKHINNKLVEEHIPHKIGIHTYPPMFAFFGKGWIAIAAERLPLGWGELGKIEPMGKCQIDTKVVPILFISLFTKA
jgi:hypothetical protein